MGHDERVAAVGQSGEFPPGGLHAVAELDECLAIGRRQGGEVFAETLELRRREPAPLGDVHAVPVAIVDLLPLILDPQRKLAGLGEMMGEIPATLERRGQQVGPMRLGPLRRGLHLPPAAGGQFGIDAPPQDVAAARLAMAQQVHRDVPAAGGHRRWPSLLILTAR